MNIGIGIGLIHIAQIGIGIGVGIGIGIIHIAQIGIARATTTKAGPKSSYSTAATRAASLPGPRACAICVCPN